MVRREARGGFATQLTITAISAAVIAVVFREYFVVLLLGAAFVALITTVVNRGLGDSGQEARESARLSVLSSKSYI